jgi:hypothetical protein
VRKEGLIKYRSKGSEDGRKVGKELLKKGRMYDRGWKDRRVLYPKQAKYFLL